jgi:hypothetical protein
VGSDLNLEIWSPNGAGTSTKTVIGDDMNNVNIAKDGTYAGIIGASGVVKIWSLGSNTLETSFTESAGSNVTASSASPDS